MRNLLLALLFSPLLLAAQDRPEYAALLIPAALQKDADAVIRHRTVEFEVKGPGEATLRETRVVTLFNDNSDYDVLAIGYDNFKKLGKIKGRVYDALGQLVREAEKSEIKDVSAISDYSIYEDNRVRYVDINYTDFPYTVEFEYETTWRDLLGYPNWDLTDFNTAVQHSVFTLKLPEGMEVETQALNLDISPVQKLEKNHKILTWTAENLPAVKAEPYAPPVSELLPELLVSPHQFEARDYRGSMASWKDFGDFMNVLMLGRDELSPAMKAKVAELTAGAATDREKIEVLYRYLQQTMRYVSVQVGVGGWQPFDANYVEKNKYGDCKALSNFMKALLKEAGITAWPVLIKNGNLSYEATADFAEPGAFNHMILHVPSEQMWLECTSSEVPPNYIGANNSGRNVVLLTEGGGKLARTPDLSPMENLESNEVNIVLQAMGEATMDVKTLSRGESHEGYRGALAALSKADLEEKFQEGISLPNFTLENLVVQPDKNKPEATVTFRAVVPRFGSKSGKRLFVPLNALNPFTAIPPANDDRRHPVLVRRGYVEEDRVTITLPPGYAVESMPNENFTLESPYGNYSLKVAQAKGQVTVERRFEKLPVRLPASEYTAWRNFFKEVAKMDGAKLVLVDKT